MKEGSSKGRSKEVWGGMGGVTVATLGVSVFQSAFLLLRCWEARSMKRKGLGVGLGAEEFAIILNI